MWLSLSLVVMTKLVSVQGVGLAHIQHRWTDGFDGQVLVPLTHQPQGWRIHLVFDQPVQTLRASEAVVAGKVGEREFILSNHDYNSRLYVDKFPVSFLGHVTGTAPTLVCAYFEGQDNPHDCDIPVGTTKTIPFTTCNAAGTTRRVTTKMTSTTPPPTTAPVPAGLHHTPVIPPTVSSQEGMEFRILERSHQGNFLAQVKLPLDHPVNGWTAHLLFDKPLTSLQGLEENVRQLTDHEFVLSNMNSNSHQQKAITIVFQASTTGELPTTVCAYIEGGATQRQCASSGHA